MASVYILFSQNADSYYIGSCKDLKERLKQHQKKEFIGFTANDDDWKLFYSIEGLGYKQSRDIESHIKRMKSRKYLQSLVQFPEIIEKLMIKYI